MIDGNLKCYLDFLEGYTKQCDRALDMRVANFTLLFAEKELTGGCTSVISSNFAGDIPRLKFPEIDKLNGFQFPIYVNKFDCNNSYYGCCNCVNSANPHEVMLACFDGSNHIDENEFIKAKIYDYALALKCILWANDQLSRQASEDEFMMLFAFIQNPYLILTGVQDWINFFNMELSAAGSTNRMNQFEIFLKVVATYFELLDEEIVHKQRMFDVGVIQSNEHLLNVLIRCLSELCEKLRNGNSFIKNDLIKLISASGKLAQNIFWPMDTVRRGKENCILVEQFQELQVNSQLSDFCMQLNSIEMKVEQWSRKIRSEAKEKRLDSTVNEH